MKTLVLLISTILLSLSAYSQSYLGKSVEEIKQIAESSYEDVEVISATPTALKLECDNEVNEFIIENNRCVKFNSTKSYTCDCLNKDIRAHNENLKAIGSLKWVSKEGDKLYEMKLNLKDYTVSITKNEENNLATTKTN